MSKSSTDVLDLRYVEEVGKDCKDFELLYASRDFRILFSTGFLGYTGHTKECAKLVKVRCFASHTRLAEIFVGLLSPQLECVLGLSSRMYEIAGYEVHFSQDFSYGEVTVRAGQTALIQSEQMLIAWADQAYNNWRHTRPGVVVRLVKPGGALFDSSFRTPKEVDTLGGHQQIKEGTSTGPITPQDSIEPYMRDISPKPRKTKKAKRKDKRARRPNNHGAEAGLDTGMIERMMEEQHLSDESMAYPLIEQTEMDLD